MLRIHTAADQERGTVLRLEGSLTGPWIAELHRVLEAVPAGALAVDLTALAYADKDGQHLLRQLANRAELRGCSPFLAELLNGMEGARASSRAATAPKAPWREDSRLVTDLLGGDQQAFLRLVGREHSSMIRYAELFVSARARAEEIVREAWVGILAGLTKFKGHSSLRSWMFSVVADCAKSRGVSEDRSGSLALAEDGEGDAVEPERFSPAGSRQAGQWRQPPEPWPEDGVEWAEIPELARKTIAQFPALRRQVIFLRDVEGWSAEEVRALLGITDRDQRALLHRARSSLHTRLEGYFAERRALPVSVGHERSVGS